MFRFDPNDVDPVVRSVERRIRREAIRQLDSVDLDDDDDRVEPLPPLAPSDTIEHEVAEAARHRSGRAGER